MTTQTEAQRLLAAWNDAWKRPILTARCKKAGSEMAVKMLRLEAANAEQAKHLVFVERWAVHHGTKPHWKPEDVLSVIQHYPAIKAITNGYEDGKAPGTFDPFARIAELEAANAELLEALRLISRTSLDRGAQDLARAAIKKHGGNT